MTSSDDRMGGRAGRFVRRAAACALVLAASIVHAAAPGTVIANQASVTAQIGSTPFANRSNVVNTTVGLSLGSSRSSAVLAATTIVESQPGATVLVAHTLTNTGAATDIYTLRIADQSNGGWSFASVALFVDANGDGQPDSATPITTPVTLGPGQVFRFVARLVVPANIGLQMQNDASVSAAAASGGLITPVTDRVMLPDRNIPMDCGTVSKSLSMLSGPSPAGPLTVRLTYNACDKPRARLLITDRLPAGMHYVAGSARFTGAGATPLTDDVAGNDRQGTGSEIAYDFNVTSPGAVTANVFNIPALGTGTVSFDVEIDSGVAMGTSIPNTAKYTYYDPNGAYMGEHETNVAAYLVTGRADFELTGEHIPVATPGTILTFNNVLTNHGDAADTFDITLAGSTFPAGTTFTLFKSDGVTPLADTNGNGVPDTGVVAAGASYRIVVKASLPANTAPGTYKVTKTARSVSSPNRTSSADDAVDGVANRCVVSLDPDNDAQIGFGQHVTYTHWLTNRGNCQERVRAMADYLANSRPGWTSAVYVDNTAAGNGSIPGAVDSTDTQMQQGWSAALAPGETLRVLVDVHAPSREAAAKAAKAIADSNVTTLVIASAQSGSLTVRDTTQVDDRDPVGQPQNVIRNFTDGTYGAPTLSGPIGGYLWLRADAQACNASPDTVETRTVIVTNANGDREELTATETGPDTGVFTTAALPVSLPPVVAGDRAIEGRVNDVVDIEILGCGRRIASVITLVAPVSIVFDSATNEPVAGAMVTLVKASGGQCTTTPLSWGTTVAASNPTQTIQTGRFEFPEVPEGDYCFSVQPPNGYRFASRVPWTQLPEGRNLNVSGAVSGGSYGQPFHLAAPGIIMMDIPVDAIAQDGLFVSKLALRSVVEVGEFVDYAVRVRNSTGNILNRGVVTLTDDLPAGFAYMPGSARRGGQPIADPLGGRGPRITFTVGTLDRDEEATITYRTVAGPGALQGDGVNRVQARYSANGTTTLSNVSTATVQVTGGVFTDKGFILGKVFMDCNANGVQDKGELGVPGVRLILEDGTYILTDGFGKFSFYGVSNRTHVVKADSTTLPAGARLAVISSRNLGDAGSRIVDLKAGELHRADFAVAGCDAPVVDEVMKRAEALTKKADELGALASAKLEPDRLPISDPKTLPASGVVSVTTPLATPGAATFVAPVKTGAQLPSPRPSPKGEGEAPSPRPSPKAEGDVPPKAAGEVPLEALVPTLDNKLGFVGMTDGQTLPYAQASIRVKGTAGATLALSVNGVAVPETHVGKRSVLEDKHVQAWEYIGVDLKPGDNTLVLTQRDAFGNERGRETIHVKAPGRLARVVLELPAGGAIADGRTGAKVGVRLLDANGLPVTVRTPVTLEATRGQWDAQDLDPIESGLQVMVENGRGEFLLVAPTEPGESRLVASSGTVKAEARLDFLPELRSMIAAGVIEGIINVRKLDAKSLMPARASDGFEQELQHFSRSSSDGKTEAGARAAFFLKGKIRGEYLLTAAYDSDKDTRERLFRDIQPDEFYPVYGDSALRGYDAQSTARMYLRVDHQKSYLLYGDFTTQGDMNVRRLSGYSRSLTGLREHYESGRVVANVFASRDTTRQVIDEVPANGTSGPYFLTAANGLVNSEKVEILTRDRNRPSLVLGSVPQARFYDYEIEPLTGRILFKSPVPSVDQNLNPVTIRITYEVDQGGEQFWVYGGDAAVKVTDNVEVGGSFAEDRNPAAPFKLRGAHAIVRIAEHTSMAFEFARTERPDTDLNGNAGRVHFKHDGEKLKAEAFVARTDPTFDNPGAYLGQGRGESGARASYKVNDATTLRAEALRTEDTLNHNVRDGAMVTAEHAFDHGIKAEVGVRHARETGGPAIPATIVGEGSDGTTPRDVTSVRTRVTAPMPFVKADATVYGEVEVDTQDAERKVVAVGGNYALPNRGKVYFRHEFISSLTGPYGLNDQQRQNTTILGLDTEYMKDARVFSEYRIQDATSGGDTQAAIGLRNLWTLAEGLRLGTNLERVHSLSGNAQAENTAVALALEYVANPLWKGSTRIEVRDASTQQSLLHTIGFASRISTDWTFLGRNTYSIQRNKGGELDGAEHVLDRMQAGVAYRDSRTDKVNALARVEHREERDNTQAGIDLKRSTELLSLHADWKPVRPFVFTGHYAAKWTRESSNGISTRYRAQLASGRVTWEFAPKWDVGLAASGLFGEQNSSRQYGLGIEVGYLLATNLWVSVGYNVLGYHDDDLAAGESTGKGAYVRLRYKFDEAAFAAAGEGTK